MAEGVTPAVTAWLCEHVGVVPALTFHPFPGGRSNLTYRVQDADGRRIVLRRPPLVRGQPTAHDMQREHDMLRALVGSPVPVPTPLGLCTDLAVAGVPFFAMEHVDGRVLTDRTAVEASVPERDRAQLARDVTDLLATLHSVDPDGFGLAGSARGAGYLTRQIARFRTQVEQMDGAAGPALARLAGRLATVVPAQTVTSVVHGDYRLGNLVVANDPGGKISIRAVLDWELATIGDPLADLAWMLVYWSGPDGSALEGLTMPTCSPGFPTAEAMAERYAQTTGRDLGPIAFYRAFAAWKLAVILTGVRSREANDECGRATRAAIPARTVDRLVDGAWEMLKQGTR